MQEVKPVYSREENRDLYVSLSDEQIRRATKYGELVNLQKGDLLFNEGMKFPPLHVLLVGRIGVYQTTGKTTVKLTEICERGEFTGDTSMMAGNAAVARGMAESSVQALKISNRNLKHLLVEDSDLSDVIVSTLIRRRAQLNTQGLSNIQVIGSRHSKDTYRIREFLLRNTIPANFLDTEEFDDVEALLAELKITPQETPIVLFRGVDVYKNPSNETIAQLLGIGDLEGGQDFYDVIIVGAGPGGLAAAINAASDGLSVLVMDEHGPGGQSSSSSKIENYLGFPMGISGQELAEKASFQAQKFGVKIASEQVATKLSRAGNLYEVEVKQGNKVFGRSVIIATGARYIKLPLPNLSEFEGKSIFYGSTRMEAQFCVEQDVALIGAGNSAGQGAVFLSQHAKHVHMLVRGKDLESRMSRYLIRRIEEAPNVTVHFQHEVKELTGQNGSLSEITISDNATGEVRSLAISRLFSFIGAKPYTKWLGDSIITDEKGFIKTGSAISKDELFSCNWPLQRLPELFETSLPLVYAVGDVRSTSAKRVASAVGEGSICIGLVYEALQGE